jgi:hypothetical protein
MLEIELGHGNHVLSVIDQGERTGIVIREKKNHGQVVGKPTQHGDTPPVLVDTDIVIWIDGDEVGKTLMLTVAEAVNNKSFPPRPPRLCNEPRGVACALCPNQGERTGIVIREKKNHVQVVGKPTQHGDTPPVLEEKAS